MSSVSFVIASLGAARHAHAGFEILILTTIVGLLLGAFNAWGWYKLASLAEGRLKLTSPSKREWYFGTLYAAAAAWVLVTNFTGYWLMSGILRQNV
jgi:hypothetical protein